MRREKLGEGVDQQQGRQPGKRKGLRCLTKISSFNEEVRAASLTSRGDHKVGKQIRRQADAQRAAACQAGVGSHPCLQVAGVIGVTP